MQKQWIRQTMKPHRASMIKSLSKILLTTRMKATMIFCYKVDLRN